MPRSTALATRNAAPFLPTLAYNLTAAPARMPLAALRLGAKAAARAGSLVFPVGVGGSSYPSFAGLFRERRPWGGGPWGTGWREAAAFDYARAVGDGLSSSILVACLNVLADAFPEPGPPKVYREDAQGEYDVVARHPLTMLLRRPNPYMPWEELAKWLVWSQHLYGEAYFYKVRSGAGKVVELWPMHPAHVAPQWPLTADNTTWISHYLYAPNGQAIILAIDDVLHLPLQRDPDEPRRGRSPLKSLFLELFTAQEAGHFQAALLKNLGIPGVLLTPDPEAKGFDREMADVMKERLAALAGGDRRGEPMVLPGPMKVEILSFSPDQMNLEALNAIPETRISAVLGVPAILAHLKAGLDRGTYANAEQLRGHFTDSKLVPYWRLIQAQLTLGLLPDFGGSDGDELRFDLSDVRALAPDENEKVERLDKGVRGGWIMVNEARRDVGLPDLPNGDLLYVPVRVAPTNGEQLADLPAMLSPATFNPAAPPTTTTEPPATAPLPGKALDDALALAKTAEGQYQAAAGQQQQATERLEAHLGLLGRALHAVQAEVIEVRATAARVEAKQSEAAAEAGPPPAPAEPAPPPTRTRKAVERDDQGRIVAVIETTEPTEPTDPERTP